MKTIITFGTFDTLHIGHINILNRAKSYGDKLIVGVSSDMLNFIKKNIFPIFCENDRLEIIENLKAVDEVFLEESLEQKREYILNYKADILVMGDDWKGKFDKFNHLCEVKYLSRTPQISSTNIKSFIK